MAKKNVYYFEVHLKNAYTSEEIEYQEISRHISRIIEQHSVNLGIYRSVELSQDEEMHTVLDVFDYKENRLFGRLSKQKPNNSIIQRNYLTYQKEDILGENDNENGIEQYTYVYINYISGILSIVGVFGAPAEKAICNLFFKYEREYMLDLLPIPNRNAISSVYNGEEAEITKVDIAVPLPNAGVLANVLQWDDGEILEAISNRGLEAQIVVKPIRRKSDITRDSDESKRLINCLKSALPKYTRAKINAKAKNAKLREYDMFADYFSYPIDVPYYYIKDYIKIYYSVDDLVDIYRQHLLGAYNENEVILETITGRRQINE